MTKKKSFEGSEELHSIYSTMAEHVVSKEIPRYQDKEFLRNELVWA